MRFAVIRDVLAHLKYIQHRPGHDLEKGGREFFDSDNDHVSGRELRQSVRDNPEIHLLMHKLTFSPDIDIHDHKEMIRDVMKQFGSAKGLDLDGRWQAVVHRNTNNPHVHMLLSGKDANGRTVMLRRQDHDRLRSIADTWLDREYPHERFEKELERQTRKLDKERQNEASKLARQRLKDNMKERLEAIEENLYASQNPFQGKPFQKQIILRMYPHALKAQRDERDKAALDSKAEIRSVFTNFIENADGTTTHKGGEVLQNKIEEYKIRYRFVNREGNPVETKDYTFDSPSNEYKHVHELKRLLEFLRHNPSQVDSPNPVKAARDPKLMSGEKFDMLKKWVQIKNTEMIDKRIDKVFQRQLSRGPERAPLSVGPTMWVDQTSGAGGDGGLNALQLPLGYLSATVKYLKQEREVAVHLKSEDRPAKSLPEKLLREAGKASHRDFAQERLKSMDEKFAALKALRIDNLPQSRRAEVDRRLDELESDRKRLERERLERGMQRRKQRDDELDFEDRDL